MKRFIRRLSSFVMILTFAAIPVGYTKPAVTQDVAIVAQKTIPFKSPSDFVKTLLPDAKKLGAAHNIDPKILIAHAAHETNWGRAIPKHKNGQSSHNLFGMKASPKSLNAVTVKTNEYTNGKKISYQARFQAYSSYRDSLAAYVKLISQERYKKAYENKQQPSAYFTHLQKAGYATDPQFAKKLMAVYNHSLIKNIV